MLNCHAMRSLLLLLLWTSQSSFAADREPGSEVCDDGKYGAEKDLGGEENWKCMSKPFSLKTLYLPAGKEECSSSSDYDPEPVCIQTDLYYLDQPPSRGSYRPLVPKYGVYHYLPPQRWLHTVKLGGVAFLYHPCTYSEQVDQLKDLARSCLNNYVVTPYLNLTEDYPLAVVTWGCVYRLRWVNPVEVKTWLLKIGIQNTADPQNNVYATGLLQEVQTRDFDSLCQYIDGGSVPATERWSGDPTPLSGDPTPPPLSVPPPSAQPPISTASPCDVTAGRDPPCVANTIRTLHRHRKGLTVLVVLLGVVLLGFMLLLAFKVFSTWSRTPPRNRKYKAVSRYFPFSYAKQTTEEVIVPAVGMPKTGAAERQVLLNESDEDEL